MENRDRELAEKIWCHRQQIADQLDPEDTFYKLFQDDIFTIDHKNIFEQKETNADKTDILFKLLVISRKRRAFRVFRKCMEMKCPQLAEEMDSTGQTPSEVEVYSGYKVAKQIRETAALSKWKDIARELRMTEADIIAVKAADPHDIKEQCTKTVLSFWDSCPSSDWSKLKEVLDALRELGLNEAAARQL